MARQLISMYHCLAKRLLSSALSSTASFSTFLGGKEVLVAASHRRFASTGLEMNMSQITKTSSSFCRAAMPGQTLKLGDVVPNFSSDTTQGNIDFHSWIQVKNARLHEPALHGAFSIVRTAGLSSSLTLLTTPQCVPLSWAGQRGSFKLKNQTDTSSRVQMLSNDFAKRGVKLIALSCDEVGKTRVDPLF